MIRVQSQPIAPARDHAAIVAPPYAALILSGAKTVESRLSVNRREPFGRVSVGESIWFRVRGGAYFARATADRVEFHEDLTPKLVEGLRQRLDEAVLGGAAYWLSKRAARYATLIWLADIRPVRAGPAIAFRPRAGWALSPAASRARPSRTARPRPGADTPGPRPRRAGRDRSPA